MAYDIAIAGTKTKEQAEKLLAALIDYFVIDNIFLYGGYVEKDNTYHQECEFVVYLKLQSSQTALEYQMFADGWLYANK